MRWKRQISFALFLGILLPFILTGCVKESLTDVTSSQAQPQANQPIEISVAFWEIVKEFSLGVEDLVLQKIQNDLNINLKPINISNNNWTAEMQKFAASGNLPDISFHDIVGTATYEAWIDQKIVRKIPKDLSKYPLLDKYVNQPYSDTFRREDGNLYMIPRLTYPTEEMWALDRCIIVRKDWMEKLNIKDPQSFEEFQSMLEKFTTLDPDGNGVADTTGFTAVNMNLLEAIYLGIYPEMSNTERGWVKEDDKWMPVYNAKGVGDALAHLQLLYKKSLMNIDFAYQGTSIAQDDFINGKVGALATQYYALAEKWKMYNPDIPLSDVAKVMPMWKAPDGNRYRLTTSLHWSETYISNSVDDVKLDKILELYNYLLTDEAYELISFGIEYLDWEMQNGKRILLKNNYEYDEIKAIYPSVTVFRSLVSWNQGRNYENTMQNHMVFGEEATLYGIEALEKTVNETKRVNYNFDIAFISTPAKNLLPTHKVIHDYMLKVIVDERPANEAWNETITKIRQESTLNQAIDEVTELANKMGIK